MLLLEPVDHVAQLRRARLQVREHAPVLQRVVPGHDPAVRRAVHAQRPVVLADGHPVQERADRGRVDVAGLELGDHLAQALQLGAQAVVHVDQVLAGGLLVGRVAGAGLRARPLGPVRLVPDRLARPRRVPSSGVGVTANGWAPSGAAGAAAHAAPRAPPRPRGSPRSRSTSSRTAGATSSANSAHRLVVLHGQDVRAHALLQGQLGQLLGPVGRAALQEAAPGAELAVDVVEPADLARVAPGVVRRLVDRLVQRAELVRVGVAHAGDPAVGAGAGQRQHARLVRAQPDLDVVPGAGPGCAPASE